MEDEKDNAKEQENWEEKKRTRGKDGKEIKENAEN